MKHQGLRPEQIENLRALLREGLGAEGQVSGGDLVCWLEAEHLVSICHRLKEDPRLAFDYFACLSLVDNLDHFEAVYHLFSIGRGWRLVLKIRLPQEMPNLPSLVSIWKGANWHEREAAEMFGVRFDGHPHLESLLLEEGFTDHPLLKSYALPE